MASNRAGKQKDRDNTVAVHDKDKENIDWKNWSFVQSDPYNFCIFLQQ